MSKELKYRFGTVSDQYRGNIRPVSRQNSVQCHRCLDENETLSMMVSVYMLQGLGLISFTLTPLSLKAVSLEKLQTSAEFSSFAGTKKKSSATKFCRRIPTLTHTKIPALVSMAKSRLQAALANEKGIDYKKLAQKKKHKEALRRNRKAGKGGVTGKKSKKDEVDEEDEDDWEGVDDEDGEEEVGEGTNELNAASAFMDEFAEEVDDEDADTDEDELDGGVSIRIAYNSPILFSVANSSFRSVCPL